MIECHNDMKRPTLTCIVVQIMNTTVIVIISY